MALAASGCDGAIVLHHKPRLLSDNDPSYIAGELTEYIEANKMSRVRDAPMPTSGAVGQEYALLRAALGEDLRRLSQIQSVERKIAAKRGMIARYRDWITGALAAERPAQDEALSGHAFRHGRGMILHHWPHRHTGTKVADWNRSSGSGTRPVQYSKGRSARCSVNSNFCSAPRNHLRCECLPISPSSACN